MGMPVTDDQLRHAVVLLPAELRTQIEQTAKRADFVSLAAAIARARQHQSALADALEPLAEDFRYDEILALLERTGADDTA